MEKKEKIIQVNYWKRLQKDSDEIIGNIHGVTILVHNSVFFQDIVDFLNKIKKDDELTVLYISLINSFRRMKETLDKKPLKNKKLQVVDCVSGFIVDHEDTTECIYRSPPSNLHKLKKMVMENIERVNPDILVVDSVSQFINFSMPTDQGINDLYKFLREIKENVLGLAEDSIILLYDDKIGLLRTIPIMNIDQVIKLEVIRDKIKWKD